MTDSNTGSNDPDTDANGGNKGEQGEPANKPPEKRSKIPLYILAGVVILLIVAGLEHYFANRNLESTDDAQVDGDAVTMQAKVSGYVTELSVTDNQHVDAGQLLFRIDSRDYAATRDQARGSLLQAQAQLANAQASLEMTRISAPAKLVQARAQRESAAASRAYALSDLSRQTGVDHRSTTQQSIDQADQNLQSANATLVNDQAGERIADLIPQTLAQAKAQVDEAAAQVVQAQAQLDSAALNLGFTEVRAPSEGWVTQRNVALGSYVSAGQSALSLVSSNFWITANFKENQLQRMRVGQHVKIKVDAYKNLKLEGHIDSLQMGTGSRFSSFPAENATGNFIKIVQRVPVKIVIDRGRDGNQPLPLGLSVDPEVELQ